MRRMLGVEETGGPFVQRESLRYRRADDIGLTRRRVAQTGAREGGGACDADRAQPSALADSWSVKMRSPKFAADADVVRDPLVIRGSADDDCMPSKSASPVNNLRHHEPRLPTVEEPARGGLYLR